GDHEMSPVPHEFGRADVERRQPVFRGISRSMSALRGEVRGADGPARYQPTRGVDDKDLESCLDEVRGRKPKHGTERRTEVRRAGKARLVRRVRKRHAGRYRDD